MSQDNKKVKDASDVTDEATSEGNTNKPQAEETSENLAASETQDPEVQTTTDVSPEPEIPDASDEDGREEISEEAGETTSANEPEADTDTEAVEASSDAAEEQVDESSKDTQPDEDVPFDFLAMDDAHWYVVHTYSGHEKKVASSLKQRIESMRLQDKILDILVPTQEKIEVRKGKKEKLSEKIFPGYILVRMVIDDYTWLAVRTTPGVTGFVGAGNKPTPIPDEEVKAIQKFMEMEAPKYKTVFSVGEAVKIIDGPFSEFLGTVDTIDEAKGKIKVLVSIFGRETPVELDFLQVSKL